MLTALLFLAIAAPVPQHTPESIATKTIAGKTFYCLWDGQDWLLEFAADGKYWGRFLDIYDENSLEEQPYDWAGQWTLREGVLHVREWLIEQGEVGAIEWTLNLAPDRDTPSTIAGVGWFGKNPAFVFKAFFIPSQPLDVLKRLKEMVEK